MNKKTFNLIFAIVSGVEMIAEGVVSFFQPSAMVAINAAIPLVGSCIIAVCKLFVKEDTTK